MSTPGARLPLADEVVARLREAVASGRWAVGTKIPSEPELIAEFGVSRGTLREAVKALAHAGLFEVLRGDGTYVRATSEISGTAQRVYREHADEDVLQVRFALDTQAARLAAGAADAAVVGLLRALLVRRRESWEAGDYEAWSAADWEFHLRVAEASENTLLHELYESFGDVFHGTKMVQRLEAGFDGCLAAGHEELLEAIEAGDGDAAVRTVIANLDYCMGWMPGR
ncbi:FadR/GntR family transcriptional regulator [Paeniglutamicibacter psychrophenolicus]|uniref:FadR/GntR family transcriptional regulator n=1 Tax=Paeniglutamicibacter psychrophenolicus TaxID=257454 RepID=UPI00278B8B5B|nr:FCD domain-containing protein [Paeniglutamicibacter psychrophenolicus]MDQ0093705.1 DNA-binding FadR family transcriptional regulator [Paeniglutamicibacter psychrophenolicus]